MSSLLRLERQQKRFLKLCVEFAYSSFFLIYNTFIHFLSFLENHTRFQTEVGKVYTRFQTKTRKKPTLCNGTYRIGLYKGSPPGFLIICALLFWSASITFCSTAWTSWSSLITSTIRQFIPRHIPIVKDRWIHSPLISSRLLLLP